MDAPDRTPLSDARLTALEEHAARAEYTLDQLSAQLRELYDRVDALARRIERSEDRILRALESTPDAPQVADAGEPGSDAAGFAAPSQDQ